MDTIEYYNKFASVIFEETVDEDVSEIRQEFLSYLEEGDTILDLGCGSGRDSLAFYELGYDVTPLDASEEMCKLAEIHTGLEVLQMNYEDMEFDDVFDGIWGKEALIHLPDDELDDVMERIIEALCQDGVLYLSFIKGDFEGSRGGRYICEHSREYLEHLIEKSGRLQLLKVWESAGKDGDDETLVHILAKKIG